MDNDECWRRLEAELLGRLAVRSGGGVDIFPINYLVHERALYFRSGPGSKLVDLTKEPSVAFEIDGHAAHHVWSVVVTGQALRLGSDLDIEASGVHELEAWYPATTFNYVRLEPESITGRNFARH